MCQAVYQALSGTHKKKQNRFKSYLGNTWDRTREISPGARVCSIIEWVNGNRREKIKGDEIIQLKQWFWTQPTHQCHPGSFWQISMSEHHRGDGERVFCICCFMRLALLSTLKGTLVDFFFFLMEYCYYSSEVWGFYCYFLSSGKHGARRGAPNGTLPTSGANLTRGIGSARDGLV